MSKLRQRLKPYYYALRSTLLFRFLNTFANLFLRHNNLIAAFIAAKLMRNKLVLGRNAVLRHCRFEIHGSGNTVIVGDDCKLSGVRVYTNSGKNKLVIGRNTIVNASKRQRTLFNPCGGREIIIGEQCMFSNSIEMHTTDYHKIIIDGKQTNANQDIVIGRHCWIGLQCLILKGTVLADDVIVGARSLVNRRIEESNAVIAGNPAKVIKTGVTWEY